MRLSFREAIQRLSEDNTCCPKCGRHGNNLISRERKKPELDDLGNPLMDRGKPVESSYTSYRCLNCGQQFTTAVEIVYSPRVEYKEYVGDTTRKDESLDTML